MAFLDNAFSKLDNNKKIIIINSAMEEFSKNTYDKASTNRIVEKAGISKGSLFNYFGSKEKLYKALEIFAIKEMTDAIVERLNWEESDILKRIKEIVTIKLEVCHKYPYLIGFSKRISAGKSTEDLIEIYEEYVPDMYEKIYHKNIDFSLFEEGIEIKEVMNILIWTFEKMGESYLKTIKTEEKIDLDEISDEVDRYIKVLRVGFYR